MNTKETLMGSKIAEALEKKKSDINSFVWKGRKIEINGQFVQEEKRLVDCSEQELNDFYNHCNSMLLNKSDKDPGRYVLLNIIRDQRKRCNAELFLRWLEDPEEFGFPRFKFLEALRSFMDTNKEVLNPEKFPISGVLDSEDKQQCPSEFADIPCSVILEGCLDRLGRFDKKHLTLSFILKQGLWFTSQESKDLAIKDENGNIRDRIEVVRENLKLPSTIKIHTNPKGLSYSQLRSMINLKSKKYSDLTTDQLRLLRDRILFSLEDDVRMHIDQWEQRMEQIIKVMQAKGYTLPAGAEE